jgi:Tfp pilus assembly protein PilF
MRKNILIIILMFFLFVTIYAQEKTLDKEASAYIKLGWELISLGKLKEANSNFKKAVDLEPENKEALTGLAKTFMYLDKNKEAEDTFNKVLKLDPNNEAATISLAKIYSWGGRYKESIDLYKKAIDIAPANKEIRVGLAEVYKWAGYRKESVSSYEELLREDPRSEKVYKGLAEVYLWDDRLKEAEHIYLEAIKLMPGKVELHLGLAEVYNWMSFWSGAESEYRKVLTIEPKNIEALEGIKNIQKELIPEQDMFVNFTREVDASDWRATTTIYGYKNTRIYDYGNNFYASYYFSDYRETGHSHKVANILDLGGKYNFRDSLTLLGSINMRNYTHEPSFFAGADVTTILKYYRKNTLSVNYARDVFDVLDNIRNNRYGVESNIYIGRFFQLTDSYSYSDYSDSNWSTDNYHILNFIFSKKKPDLSIGFGYRRRDFKESSSQYYSPKNLQSFIYSVYCGKAFKKGYFYGLFKYNDNNDHVDTYYYSLGSDYSFNDSFSILAEVDYFDSESKYHALTATLTAKFKF